jgi:hypothetical protein
MRRRATAVAAAITVAAAVLVGGVVAGGFDWSRSSEELRRAQVEEAPTRVADIPAADGLPARGVFAQITSTGHFCLSDAPVGEPLLGGGGCNPADDPLAGGVVSASLAYDGGPAIDSVKDARLIGIADERVAALRVLMNDGSSRAVKLKKAAVRTSEVRVFGYRFRKSDLKKGIGPIAVIALDAGGAEIGRQMTGIG